MTASYRGRPLFSYAMERGVAGRYEAKHPRITALVAASDAIAATVLCALAAANGATETLLWILIVGAVSAPAMAFAFGVSAGTLSLGLFAAGFVVSSLL